MSETTEETGDLHEAETGSQWEFLGKPPTRQEVADLLSTLPWLWGVNPVAYIDYVQALGQKKKFKRPHPDPSKSNLMIDDYVEAFSLYVSVAGRQQMLREAQEKNGWRVDIKPEPTTPTGIPGYLSFSGRLVYRVYVDIYAPIGAPLKLPDLDQSPTAYVRKWQLLGTRSGTAWVPESGGAQAAGSNPYEKVETSALGRALGGWGFGVLPGSGIATVEEMAAIASNRSAIDRQDRSTRGGGGGDGQPQQQREDRHSLLQSTLATIEAYRQEAGKTDDEMQQQVAQYLVQRLGIPGAWDGQQVVWDAVKDGQLVMARAAMREGVKRLRDEGFGA